ncbi:hypothetical protein, partial [Photobacterium sp. R1]
WTADHFATTTRLVKTGLGVAQSAQSLLGKHRMTAISDTARRWSHNNTPQWLPELPTINRHALTESGNRPAHGEKKVVYLPS